MEVQKSGNPRVGDSGTGGWAVEVQKSNLTTVSGRMEYPDAPRLLFDSCSVNIPAFPSSIPV
jgi:hypothetical protein